MIVVDSSVWIGFFCGATTGPVERLRSMPDPNLIVVGDLVLLECLQGARSERDAAKLEEALRQFTVLPMGGDRLAVEAARHVRALRAIGVTTRKTIDVVIASFCLHHGFSLLHDDRDFEPWAVHMGLRTV